MSRERERERESRERRDHNFQNNSNSNSNPSPDPNSPSISTIFVRNIPDILDVLGLRGIFSRVGRVVDASIPVKQSGKSRFGFVRFENQGVALRSIKAFSNKFVRGSKIWVHFARRDLSRGRQFSQNDRHFQRPVPPHPAFNVNRRADAEVFESMKSSLAGEISELSRLRIALESILSNFEDLVDSKCVRTIIGVLSEVAENLKSANPNFNLDSDHILNNPPISSPDGLFGKSVDVPGSLNEVAEVVEDSIPVETTGSKEIEEGEIQISAPDAKAGDSLELENMAVDNVHPIPFSDCAFVPPADQPGFSFKSKSKRRRKSKRNRIEKPSRARQPMHHPKPGDKRWLSSQGILPSQGCAKKVKRSTESFRKRQEGVDLSSEALIFSPNVSDDGEGVGESVESSEVGEEEKESSADEEVVEESSDFSASPNPRATPEKLVGFSEVPEDESFGLEKLFASCGQVEGANPITKEVGSSDIGIQESSRRRNNTSPRRKIVIGEGPQDNFKRSAFRAVNLCSRLGLKVIKNEEAAVRKAARIIKNQKRYVENYSSSENSLGSTEF